MNEQAREGRKVAVFVTFDTFASCQIYTFSTPFTFTFLSPRSQVTQYSISIISAIMVEMMDSEVQSGDVRQLCRETQSSFQDIDQLKKSVEFLIADFENHRSLSNQTKMSIDVYTERISKLEEMFKKVRSLPSFIRCHLK